MSQIDFYQKLKSHSGLKVLTNEPMKNHTTLKIGGPADFFVEVRSSEELQNVSRISLDEGVPFFILGSGSNILVGDKGIRGLVIKNIHGNVKVLHKTKMDYKKSDLIRKEETIFRKGILDWRNLSYEEETNEGMLVEAESGMLLSALINTALDKNLTGLQWFGRIPGTVGGAVWNNIHGADRLIWDYIDSIKYLDKNDLKVKTIAYDASHVGYNKSPFQDNTKVILSAVFKLFLGDSEKAKSTLKEWIKRKNMQPHNSAGCTFSNLSKEQKTKAGLENLSTPYLIDQVFHLRGLKVGDAEVSTSHSAFIVNNGKARAQDVIEIIQIIKQKAKDKFDIDLHEEIVRVGEF